MNLLLASVAGPAPTLFTEVTDQAFRGTAFGARSMAWKGCANDGDLYPMVGGGDFTLYWALASAQLGSTSHRRGDPAAAPLVAAIRGVSPGHRPAVV